MTQPNPTKAAFSSQISCNICPLDIGGESVLQPPGSTWEVTDFGNTQNPVSSNREIQQKAQGDALREEGWLCFEQVYQKSGGFLKGLRMVQFSSSSVVMLLQQNETHTLKSSG